MRFILRQLALTTVFVGALYLAVLAITFVVAPQQKAKGSLDVWTAGETLFLTSAKYAFLGRDALNTPDKKIVLVGASNTGLGFQPTTLQPMIACAKVSNLAIGSANISEVREMIDLLREVQSPAAQRSDVFVLGVWYGMFIDTEQHWPGADRQRGDTDLDIERYRYGFYRRTPAGPVAVLPPAWLAYGVIAIRPYLLLEKVARNMTAGLRSALFVRPPELTDADREVRTMSTADRKEALTYWRDQIGPTGQISLAQMRLLSDTIDQVLRSGEKIVLVDLPIPAWHRDSSPYQAVYSKALQTMVLDRFRSRPGFATLRMPDLNADTDYSDEVHAKPHLARIWAARLAALLNQSVCSPGAVAATSPAAANGAPVSQY